eukprot:2970914-Amphidinium_carterae.2
MAAKRLQGRLENLWTEWRCQQRSRAKERRMAQLTLMRLCHMSTSAQEETRWGSKCCSACREASEGWSRWS